MARNRRDRQGQAEKPRRLAVGQILPDWSPEAFLTLFTAVLIVLLSTVLVVELSPRSVSLAPGDVSRKNVKSPSRVSFTSPVRTKAEKDQAAAAVGPVWTHDPDVRREQRNQLTTLMSTINGIRINRSLDALARRQQLENLSTVSLSAISINTILDLNDASWQSVAQEALRVHDQIMSRQIEPSRLNDVLRQIPLFISGSLTSREAELLGDLVTPFVRPNLAVDEAATEKARQQARDSVEPARVTLQKGEIILRDGDLVKDTDMEKLEAAGLLRPNVNWRRVLGMALLTGILLVLLHHYLYALQPQLSRNRKYLALLALVLLLATLAAKFTLPGHAILPYLFPMAAVSMLLAVLLDVNLALVVTALLSLLLGFIGGGSHELATYLFVGGTVGIFGIWRAERLNRFFFSGVLVAAANMVTIFAFRLYLADYDTAGLLTLLGVGAINGAASSIITFGSFSLLGRVFGITTVLQLMELAHPNQPLLRRLLLEAPGTYHHSIVVSNLSERAAQVVGADSLLVRVGAYYHDIGKILRPYFFIENQAERENVHDRLDPYTSAHIVTGHVADGVQLARKFGLPRKLIDFIEQHHGSTMASFFYHRALAENEVVKQEDFRYPGPKPGNKETAIVMLADAVEATVRSMAQSGRFRLPPGTAAAKPAQQNGSKGQADGAEPENGGKGQPTQTIDDVVARIINARIADGQLEESDLTLRDLSKIRQAFVSILEGIYHPRIEYPEGTAQEKPHAPASEARLS